MSEAQANAIAVLRNAQQLVQDEGNDEALALAEEAATAFRQLPDTPQDEEEEQDGVVDCLRVTFRAMAQKDERKRALQLAKEELEDRLQARDLRGEAVMRLSIAETVLEKMGSKHRQEAIPNAKRAVKLFRDLEEDRLEAEALLVIANTHIKRSAPAMNVNPESQMGVDSAKDALALFRAVKDRRGEGLALHAISVGYIHLREYRQAIQLCRQAIKVYQEIGATRLEAFEQRVLARWHLRKDEPDQALKAAEKSYELFKQHEDSKSVQGWEVAALGCIVETHLLGKDVDAAVAAAMDGVKRFEEKGDKPSQAAVQDMLREAYYAKGDYQAAKEAAEKSLALVKEVEDRQLEAELLLQQAPLLGAAREGDKAADAIKEAVNIFAEVGADKDRANALQMLSEVHLGIGDEHDALKAAEDSKNLHEKLADLKGLAYAYIRAGQVHHACKRFEQAQRAYDEALAIYREGGNRKGEADALSCLARMHGDNKEPKQAVKAAELARQLYLDLGQKPAILDATLNLARLQVLLAQDSVVMGAESSAVQSEAAKALHLAREAVAMARRTGDQQTVIYAQHTEVEVLVAMGGYEEAARILVDALAVCRERHFEREKGQLTSDVAQVHMAQKEWSKASEAASKALAIARNVGDRDGETLALELLEHIEEQTVGARQVRTPGEETVPSGTGEAAAAAGSSTAEAGAQSVAVASKGPAVYPGPAKGMLTKRLQDMVMDMFEADDLENDTMLMDIGIDSLSMLDFHSRIQKEFPGTSWSTTMLFDYPTIGELASMMDDTLRNAFRRSVGN